MPSAKRRDSRSLIGDRSSRLDCAPLAREEGTTITLFNAVVRNDIDRFHLVAAVIDRVPKLGYHAAYAKQAIRDQLIEHREYISVTVTICRRSATGGGRTRERYSRRREDADARQKGERGA